MKPIRRPSLFRNGIESNRNCSNITIVLSNNINLLLSSGTKLPDIGKSQGTFIVCPLSVKGRVEALFLC